MIPKNEKNIASVINNGIYYYKVIPFSLKNARATYQWLINKVFTDQINQNMEVYNIDILIKSFKEVDYIKELEEAFSTFHQHRMKLNLSKCSFGIITRMFLEFIVTKWGIEVNPKNILVILDMQNPISKKEVH